MRIVYHEFANAAGVDAAVEQALQSGIRTLVIGLDAAPSLNDATIRDLIRALRRMRETGGNVALHVTRPDLLHALHRTALDRVFTAA
jgi:anti-anti-sigma regulatory factor